MLVNLSTENRPKANKNIPCIPPLRKKKSGSSHDVKYQLCLSTLDLTYQSLLHFKDVKQFLSALHILGKTSACKPKVKIEFN